MAGLTLYSSLNVFRMMSLLTLMLHPISTRINATF